MVRVLVKLLAVMLSIVTVSEAALVMRIADCAMDGGSASDQRRASSQKPPVELIQLLVCACETVAMMAFIATANTNQTDRLIFGLIRRQLARFREAAEQVGPRMSRRFRHSKPSLVPNCYQQASVVYSRFARQLFLILAPCSRTFASFATSSCS